MERVSNTSVPSNRPENNCDDSCFPLWYLDALGKAPARVNEFISHFMVVSFRNSKRPKHTLTDVQRKHMRLHDSCHEMLRGLHRHLSLFFSTCEHNKIHSYEE